MSNELMILFGAGAAYDCADLSKSSVNIDYRPPLTHQIFSRQIISEAGLSKVVLNQFKNKILNEHFLASSVGHEFNNSETLEDYLARLKSSILDSDRRKYFAVCAYLKELFVEISKNYLSAPLDNNYHSLLCKLVRTDYTKFNFVTTNYDTIFDNTVEKLFNVRFKSSNDYLNFSGDGKNFSYIKAHGSVNWNFILNQQCDQLNNLHNVRNGTIEVNDNIMRFVDNANNIYVGNSLEYGVVKFPAMAVPLGTYKFVNQNQINSFKNQNINFRHLLIIGYSGKDNTIFELLKSLIKEPINIFIIDKDRESVVNVFRLFKSNLSNMVRVTSESINYFPGGFTNFINEHCDSWIDRISGNPH